MRPGRKAHVHRWASLDEPRTKRRGLREACIRRGGIPARPRDARGTASYPAAVTRRPPDEDTTAPRLRLRLRITGRVQGVWYRGATEQEARKLGLDGWVRNLPDGSVEALVEGPPDAVHALVAWCRIGPPAARVLDVAQVSEPVGADLAGFRVRY